MTPDHLSFDFIAPSPNQNDTVQRRPHIILTQLRQRPTLDKLVIGAHSGHRNRQPLARTNALATPPLRLEHLRRTQGSRHEPRRLVSQPALARQQVKIGFLDLDVEQHEGVGAGGRVCRQPVVERVRPPRFRKEHHRRRRPELVQRQACRAHRAEDRRVVHRPHRDAWRVRRAPRRQVAVRGCAARVSASWRWVSAR